MSSWRPHKSGGYSPRRSYHDQRSGDNRRQDYGPPPPPPPLPPGPPPPPPPLPPGANAYRPQADRGFPNGAPPPPPQYAPYAPPYSSSYAPPYGQASQQPAAVPVPVFSGSYSYNNPPVDSRSDGRSPPGRNNYRPDYGADQYRPPQSDFTFRAERTQPFPSASQSGAREPREPNDRHPSRRERSAAREREGARGPRASQRGGAQGNQRTSQRGGNRGRGRGGFKQPHDRAFLKNTKSGARDEEMLSGSCRTYKDLDELSDDEEADMVISESGSDASQPQQKRARRSGNAAADDGDAVPRWSNPDPYTAAPADAPVRRKKDVVKLIRQARVDTADDSGDATQPEDFIPLTDDEEDDEEVQVAESFSGLAYTSPATNFNQPQPTSHSKPTLPPPRTDSGPLGSRKRFADDRIKPALPAGKKGKKMPSKGDVVPEWECVDGQDPCPWLQKDYSHMKDISKRLHNEINDFYNYVKPREFEHRMRTDLVDGLKKIIPRLGRDARVLAFGSYMSKLYLPTADMDVVVCSQAFLDGRPPRLSAKGELYKLKRLLTDKKMAEDGSIELITRAKVPLVKYVDRFTGLKVDISFENYDGVRAIKTFTDWKEQHPAMPILVTLVKHFLVMRGLNEPVNGGIGGFSVICLVTSLMQMLPRTQTLDMVPELNLGETLVEFFNLYGNKFDHNSVAIHLDPPAYKPKSEASVVYRNMDRLSIIDPNNPQNDITGGASNTDVILYEFRYAYTLLRDAIKDASVGRPVESLLAPILEGNYQSFVEQRAHLRRLHIQKFGDCPE